MSAERFFFTLDGQEMQQTDIETVVENAARADDRVLWELIRTLPYSAGGPQKLIIPYGSYTNAAYGSLSGKSLLQSSGSANAKVYVMPFRALVGSNDNSTPDKIIRDMHSAVFTGSAIPEQATIGVNVSANPRWTLVYAIVAVDADAAAVDRYYKDASSTTLQQTLVVSRKTTITIAQVDGATAATPTRPALPADGAGNYNIALGYVYVPAGFGSGTMVEKWHIHEDAPIARLHETSGSTTRRPATQQHIVGGAVDTNQVGNALVKRPGAYLPSTMVGEHKIDVLLQFSYLPVSHIDGDLIDDSIDWRDRYFEWRCYVTTGATTAAAFASDPLVTGTTPAGSALNLATLGTNFAQGQGQSFVDDTGAGAAFSPSISAGHGFAMHVTNVQMSSITSGGAAALALYVNKTNGKLYMRRVGNIVGQVRIVLEASGPYFNRGFIP